MRNHRLRAGTIKIHTPVPAKELYFHHDILIGEFFTGAHGRHRSRPHKGDNAGTHE
jgi:hypothetical protein